MENVYQIIGADLSKKTIDLFCHYSNQHLQISNDVAGFKQMLRWFKQQHIDSLGIMIVMEHTGLYGFCFEEFLHSSQIRFVKVNALIIKRSAGLARGKSDKVDAKRIAYYGVDRQSTLQPESPTSKDIQRLQLLNTVREHLVKQKAQLLNTVKEYKNINLQKQDLIIQSQTRLIKLFEKEIEKVESEIDSIIEANPDLRKNSQLLRSIKGVGKVLATTTLVKTRNFTRFSTARKFACFCGTAPFEHTSGTSIKGKTRVSHFADKRMKTLLDLAAKSAVQHDKELRAYFLKRTAEGKPKMSTINIVRNKILYRMFAIIKRQTSFVEDYLNAA